MTEVAAASLQWYVLRAVSGQEKRVKQYIESDLKRMRMEELVEQILIPTKKVYELRNGKKRKIERTLLPGYILIKAILNPELVSAITEINGVINFLDEEEKVDPAAVKAAKKEGRKIEIKRRPKPLREHELNSILGVYNEMQNQEEVLENPFLVDETVKVIDGQFNGFEGRVGEVDNDKKRLKVMVKIFGRDTPLELNFSQVERII